MGFIFKKDDSAETGIAKAYMITYGGIFLGVLTVVGLIIWGFVEFLVWVF